MTSVQTEARSPSDAAGDSSAVALSVDDMALDVATRLAEIIFKKRGNHSQIHISKNNLIVMLAAAIEVARAEGR